MAWQINYSWLEEFYNEGPSVINHGYFNAYARYRLMLSNSSGEVGEAQIGVNWVDGFRSMTLLQDIETGELQASSEEVAKAIESIDYESFILQEMSPMMALPSVEEWSSGTQYQIDDVVYYNGAIWKATSNNSNNEPDDVPGDWEKIEYDVPGDWEEIE